MQRKHKLIIIGDSAFAEIAYEYFMHDSDYEVVAFSVESDYLKRGELFGLPVVPFEQVERFSLPKEILFFGAKVYTVLNKLKTRLYRKVKKKGISRAS